MPADVSIYSLIHPLKLKTPLEAEREALDVQGMRDNARLSALQRTKLEGDLTEEQTFRGAAQEAGGNFQKMRDLLMERGAPRSAMSVETQRLKAEKEAADLQKTKVETHAAQIKGLRDQLASVNDDSALAALKDETAKIYGPQYVANMPTSVSDPRFSDWRRGQLMTADKFLEHSTPKYQTVNLGGKEITVDMNPFTNPEIRNASWAKTMTPGESANLGISRANLAIKGAEATPGGVFSIPDIVARAGAGAAAPGMMSAADFYRTNSGAPQPQGGITPAQLIRGPQNALPQGVPASSAQPSPAEPPARAGTAENPVSAAIKSGRTGDELLRMLPPEVGNVVKQMVEGRMPPPSSFALARPYWQGMMALATQYDPSFDETLWKARNATRTNFASGPEGRNLTAINTAIGHLDSLDKASQALGNRSFRGWNWFVNAALPQVSPEMSGKVRTFEQAKEAVASELMRVFKGVGSSDAEIRKWGETINGSDSPEALRAAMRSASDLLDSRIQALGEQYKRGMGTSSEVDVLGMQYPKAKATLERLRSGQQAGQTAAGKIAGVLTRNSDGSFNYGAAR